MVVKKEETVLLVMVYRIVTWEIVLGMRCLGGHFFMCFLFSAWVRASVCVCVGGDPSGIPFHLFSPPEFSLENLVRR